MSPQASFNEARIVSLVKEYYSLLVSLSYLHAAQIIDPPMSGHAINEPLCNQLGLDAAVISLMKNMPYVDGPYSDGKLDEDASAHRCMIFPGSRRGARAYSFVRDHDIVESRDPEADGMVRWRLNYLMSHDVGLAHNIRDGITVVLDTKANTVRLVDNNDRPEIANPEETPLERPWEPEHYRNYKARDAAPYFEGIISKIRSLDLIPYGGGQYERDFFLAMSVRKLYVPLDLIPTYMGERLTGSPSQRDQVKRALSEDYGWGLVDFRQEDWAADAEGVWKKIIRDS